MTKEFNTGIITTEDQHVILCYIEKHLKTGLWKTNKSMARYRNSLHFRDGHKEDNKQLVLIDYHNQCKNSLPELFADMIKQIIEAELEDPRHAKKLSWSCDCLVRPKYFCGEVTVRDCYEFCEILKNCKKSNTHKPVIKDFSILAVQPTTDEVRAAFDEMDKAEKCAERRFQKLFA